MVVGDPKIRFYAGAPLVASNGARLGSLCVIDTVPRSIDAEQCNVLVNFAEVVMREIEKEKTRLLEAARLRSSAADLLRVIDGFRECVMLADAGGDRWPVLFVNDACARGAGVDPGADAGRDFWEMFALAGPAAAAAASAAAAGEDSASAAGKPSAPVPPLPSKSPAAELVARVAAREAFHVELVRLPRKKGGGGGGSGGDDAAAPASSSSSALPPRSAARFAAHFRPASSAHLDGAPAIGIPTVASSHSLGVGAEGRGSSADALYFITVRKGALVFFFFFFFYFGFSVILSWLALLCFVLLCIIFLLCSIVSAAMRRVRVGFKPIKNRAPFFRKTRNKT